MIDKLIQILCDERGDSPPAHMGEHEKADMFRSLCNVRPPSPIRNEFLALQDQYLKSRTLERGVVDVARFEFTDAIALWQGDITRLNSDGIVNACNARLLGCFQPLHNCIDNIIHSNAGVQVRRDCHEILKGAELPNGDVVVTPAYNLPGRYLFHTVGPIVRHGQPSERDAADLAKCYRSCLEKARDMGIATLAFCCLSTGVYGYPRDQAAALAVGTVLEWLKANHGVQVVFNVFENEDKAHYERELSR